MEAIIDRTVQPIVAGHVRRAVAHIVAEANGAHSERHFIDVLTAPDQSAFEVSLVGLNGLVLEKRLRTLAQWGAAPGDLRAHPADSPT